MIRPPPTSTLFPSTTLFRSHGPGGGHPMLGSVRLAPASGDRKSTRLNSSHLGISYAVFCLKKKKNKQTNLYILRLACHRTSPRTTHVPSAPTQPSIDVIAHSCPHCVFFLFVFFFF